MTNEYKKQLLNYITGNLENTSPTYDEIIEEIIEANRNDWTDYIPHNYSGMHIEGIIKSKTSDVTILYGGYFSGSIHDGKGFIIIVDNNFKPIKYFDSFSSGTPLRYIQCLRQAEDNSFYMVDDTTYSYMYDTGPGFLLNAQRRFVMLNNFTMQVNGEYLLNLRTSYNFSTDESEGFDKQYNNIRVDNMMKDPNSSTYMFIGQRYDSKYNMMGFVLTHAIQLKINVGQSNEWKHWTFTESNERCIYGGSFISFNENNQSFFRLLSSFDGGEGIKQYTKNYNTDNLTTSTIYTNSTYPDDKIPSYNYENQCIFKSQNEVYFVASNQRRTWSGQEEDKHIGLYKYDFSNSTLTNIFDKYLGKNTLPDYYIKKESIFLSLNQGYIYILYCEDYDDNAKTANYYIQRYNGEWSPILIGQEKNCLLTQRCIYVENEYNLVKIYCCPTNTRSATWYFPLVKEIFNSNQHNGEPYISFNLFNPLYVNLYSNGSLIFSRNLYNISKQNNMTLSSVEIPNTYLNDTTISTNDLISETNFQMNSDNTQWSKNVYEIVDISFLNTITVEDIEENISYLNGATRINNSITDVNDYSNIKCSKARLNYSDNTNQIINIVWNDIDDYNKEMTFAFYVSKAILSIDYISNDENTIYCTKEPELEVGKYYTINQKIGVM